MTLPSVPLSVLDLAPVPQGSTPADALRNTTALARHTERLGFNRYWLAEHHNMTGIASAATAVVIGHVAAATSSIRVGAGGIMLPNHAPLVIAEQFGTLESLFPGRIDLGLGRAPGTDQRTARALRRNLASSDDSFPQDVAELQFYFAPPQANQPVRAVPGAGLDVPIWLLGSSLYSAELAAHLGLPFAFASHFAPRFLMQAIDLYRSRFRPSATLDEPYVMVGANAIGADSDDEAQFLLRSLRLRFAAMARGVRGTLPPPEDFRESDWTAAELAFADESLSCAAVGATSSMATQLSALVAQTGADEMILTAQIFDHQARLHSYEVLAQAWGLAPLGASRS
ncbi:LLM class flavin-dependent oxidoreductase [Parazoarcus communis]|uniref:Luciferase-like monooxygenase n=1 Tax=Parazoarcus communis TaxID=41977 RepID=A0A2U8GNR5_9RHOO|nr:LLM class flavin-dependent oxidoreductase [Parazoarcus communis]AWI75138.1 LLM class flavin-dependent oxidoreductase [Parazoarcus communis]